jgi:hypothetical protein
VGAIEYEPPLALPQTPFTTDCEKTAEKLSKKIAGTAINKKM